MERSKRGEKGRSDKRRDRARDGDAEREIERESSRREKKEREHDKNKENGRDRERDRDRDRDRERERDDRRKERDGDRDRGEHKSRREKEKDKEREERDKDNEKEKEKEKEKEQNEQQQQQQELGADSTKEIEERIARMKESRKERAAVKKDEEDDVLAWVEKSRKLEKVKVKKPAPACKSIAEQEDEEGVNEDEDESAYTSKDLAGMKIRHGLDKLIDGGEVILTLKDSRIISGGDVNEDVDELENVNIAEQTRRSDAYRDAKKKTGASEDRFQNDINTVKSLLPQYDEVPKEEGLQLDELGGVNEESQKRLEEIRLKLQGAALKMQSLLGAENKQSDFYTKEEMLKFKKPNKQKKLRKKDMLDVDALEAEAKAAGVGADDLGSRANNLKSKPEADADANSRKQSYESAFAKALEASKALRKENPEADISIADEDDELFSRLKRSREIAIKQRTQSMLGPQGIAARLKLEATEEQGAMDVDTKTSASERTVVITETEEFCLSLQPDEVISRRTATNDAFGDDDEDGQAAMETNQEEGQPATDVNDVSMKEDDRSVEEPPLKEVSVGKGLAGALHLLQERGSLKDSVEWGGRNMDKKASKLVGVLDDGGKNYEREINLERRDEYGRTLTPKESFRILSHKFHGKNPGKTKQEKKMKQHEEELKRKQMTAGDTPLKSMEKMREVQAKSSTPYIVMSGHIKPGQTSDPRSGFATVEKESIGSLTPMLGDKKVEHFLGIKRPAGDMGPPPPKKKNKV